MKSQKNPAREGRGAVIGRFVFFRKLHLVEGKRLGGKVQQTFGEVLDVGDDDLFVVRGDEVIT